MSECLCVKAPLLTARESAWQDPRSLCVKADPGMPAADCVCRMGHGHSFSEVLLHCQTQRSTAGVPCRSLTWKVQGAPLCSWDSMGEIERGLITVSDQERSLFPGVED